VHCTTRNVEREVAARFSDVAVSATGIPEQADADTAATSQRLSPLSILIRVPKPPATVRNL
jgi:hypothetical protein